MKSGWMWFDDDPERSLEDKVLRAAEAYEKKHGTSPTMCCVHPSALNGNGKVKVGQIEIRPLQSVLRFHFWLNGGTQITQSQEKAANLEKAQ